MWGKRQKAVFNRYVLRVERLRDYLAGMKYWYTNLENMKLLRCKDDENTFEHTFRIMNEVDFSAMSIQLWSILYIDLFGDVTEIDPSQWKDLHREDAVSVIPIY